MAPPGSGLARGYWLFGGLEELPFAWHWPQMSAFASALDGAACWVAVITPPPPKWQVEQPTMPSEKAPLSAATSLGYRYGSALVPVPEAGTAFRGS